MSFSEQEKQVFVKPTSFDGATAQFKVLISPWGNGIRLGHAAPHTRSDSVPEGMSARFGSYGSFGSIASYGEGWDPEKLLQFTEEVRPALTSHEIHPSSISNLDDLLRALLDDESKHEDPIGLSVVIESRLDKLLQDIIGAEQYLFPPDSQDARVLKKAADLHSSWRERFGIGYTMIDAERLSKAQSNGDLQDVTLEPNANEPVWCITRAKSPCIWATVPPGEWWPTIACAIRDGVVDSSEETVTILNSGAIVLPMLTGQEEEDLERKETILIKEGTLNEVHVRLMTCKGQIKVLRGHLLKSRYAPAAGIRYDGEYRVIQYSHRLDRDTDTYTARIRLGREHGQRTMNEIINIPKPSQQDDWKQYQKMVMAPSQATCNSKDSTEQDGGRRRLVEIIRENHYFISL